MAKQSFGKLYLQSCRRANDWRLIVYFALLILLLYAPIQGANVAFRHFFPEAHGRWFGIGLYLCWSLLYALFSVAGMRGSMGEKTNIRCDFNEGLARWKSAWLLLPSIWLFAVLITIPYIAPGSASNFALLTLALAVLGVAVVLGIAFLCAAIAAAPPGSGMKTLCRSAFRALRNGWGRGLCALLLAMLGVFLGAVADAFLNWLLSELLTRIVGYTVLSDDMYIPAFWFFAIAWCSGFYCAFFARLYAEAVPETAVSPGKDERI